MMGQVVTTVDIFAAANMDSSENLVAVKSPGKHIKHIYVYPQIYIYIYIYVFLFLHIIHICIHVFTLNIYAYMKAASQNSECRSSWL